MTLFDYDPDTLARHDFVNGHYEVGPVQTFTVDGHAIAYRIGSAALDNSCCGAYGCAYALVLGELVPPATVDTHPVRLRELASDGALAAAIRQALTAAEHVTVINFYTRPARPAETAPA